MYSQEMVVFASGTHDHPDSKHSCVWFMSVSPSLSFSLLPTYTQTKTFTDTHTHTHTHRSAHTQTQHTPHHADQHAFKQNTMSFRTMDSTTTGLDCALPCLY